MQGGGGGGGGRGGMGRGSGMLKEAAFDTIMQKIV